VREGLRRTEDITPEESKTKLHPETEELDLQSPSAAAELADLDKECKTTVVWWQRRAPQTYPLPPKSDEVYGLENPKYQLYMSMQECNKEI